MSKTMKKFTQMSIKKSKNYVDYIRFLDNKLEHHSESIALIMEHKNILEKELPTLKELREWNLA
jgi:flagellar biosynthesis chaperone FliJ